MAKDFYKILDISKDASQDEIKKAYRKLAHKYHPDKKDGDEEKFKEVNEAYQTLSDQDKKSQYDQFGQTFDQQGGGFDGGASGFGGGSPYGQASGFEDIDFIFQVRLDFRKFEKISKIIFRFYDNENTKENATK